MLWGLPLYVSVMAFNIITVDFLLSVYSNIPSSVLINAKQKAVVPLWVFSLTTLQQIFCMSLASGGKNPKSFEQFLLEQQGYKTAKIPYVTFQVVSKDFPVTGADVFWELSWFFLCVSYVDPWAVPVYTHSVPITLLRQAAPSDQSLYTYILSDPRRSRLSVWSWILSLTQTAAPLQSSVVHFVVAV